MYSFCILHSNFCISSRGFFLLHFPSDCSALTLSSTVPCAVRTFLTTGCPAARLPHLPQCRDYTQYYPRDGTMPWMNPISINPEIMHGTPCFAGTRVPVKKLFDYLARIHPLDDFLLDFPSVMREQALALISLANAGVEASTGRAGTGLNHFTDRSVRFL